LFLPHACAGTRSRKSNGLAGKIFTAIPGGLIGTTWPPNKDLTSARQRLISIDSHGLACRVRQGGAFVHNL